MLWLKKKIESEERLIFLRAIVSHKANRSSLAHKQASESVALLFFRQSTESTY